MKKKCPSEFDKIVLERNWLQEAIDAEYVLNDGRLNALLVFNAILFGAFSIIISSDGATGSRFFPLLIGLSIFGILVSELSRRAINAGITQIVKFKTRRSTVFERLQPFMPIELIGVAVTDDQHRYGILPAKFFPIAMLTAWLLALLWVLHVRLL